MKTALQITDLSICYMIGSGVLRSVESVSLNIRTGERFAIVGESGCGKSTLAKAILSLLPSNASITGGTIIFDKHNLLTLNKEGIRNIRGRHIALIPQGAMNSLNPVMRVKSQIADIITTHQGQQPRRALDDRIDKLLQQVDLPNYVANMYPHELSGGMKQRVCFAIAVALDPSVIIADEPTSALDVITQKRVMQTLIQTQKRGKATLVLIGHDLGLVAQTSERVGVMYSGRFVEIGTVRQIFKAPHHPYTQSLVVTVPSIRLLKRSEKPRVLQPSSLQPHIGCPFLLHCNQAMPVCKTHLPTLLPTPSGQFVACHLYSESRRTDG